MQTAYQVMGGFIEFQKRGPKTDQLHQRHMGSGYKHLDTQYAFPYRCLLILRSKMALITCY